MDGFRMNTWNLTVFKQYNEIHLGEYKYNFVLIKVFLGTKYRKAVPIINDPFSKTWSTIFHLSSNVYAIQIMHVPDNVREYDTVVITSELFRTLRIEVSCIANVI